MIWRGWNYMITKTTVIKLLYAIAIVSLFLVLIINRYNFHWNLYIRLLSLLPLGLVGLISLVSPSVPISVFRKHKNVTEESDYIKQQLFGLSLIILYILIALKLH